MTSRKWNLLAALAAFGLGVALLFAPYPADPVPGDGSDMMFKGILAALLGTFIFGGYAWRPPRPNSAFAPLAYGLAGICLFVVAFALLVLWTA